MKKTVTSKFEIKLEFDKNTENPSRLFRTFAEIIEDVRNLDNVLAKCINTSVSTKIFLNDIEKGSLIAKLWDELVINEDNKLDDLQEPEKISNFIEKSRSKALEFLQDNKSSVDDLEKLSDDIEEIANEENLAETFNYGKPDILELAKSLNDISETTEKLTDNEKLIVKNSNDKSEELTNNVAKIDIEDVEKALTAEEYNNESIVFYKIKKPDFLGDSQWEFKHGNKSLKIKITDVNWLEKFKNGIEIVVPGDSLKVRISQNFKYNRNGYLISEKTEIIEVLGIIKNQ
ncbi:hypothetical protein [Faecalibacter rhinopitheci]|uniref:Uncharacterized protein n=1 Tax=Faecalibacter rhinopitheci TaxID=2779678 RepID=A0A8J7G7X9_9FLAO|nr:hypothetical protein [Faecalibacter rhinopitheci]MBF0598427.1 hypothetical protein [Faecalibacter rhinopitheci]